MTGGLAEKQVVARKVRHDERRPTFASLQVGLRERQDNHFADYGLARAVSSSGVLQSFARAVSLKSRPLNDSSSCFARKNRAKSYTSRWSGSGSAMISCSINCFVLMRCLSHTVLRV